MKQKRILALLLALTAAFCLTGAANAEEETPVVREGTIVEVMDGFLLQEADGREILYNVDEQTVLDGIASLTDLQKDLYVIVESDGRLTKSIPPQAHADRVTCYWLAGQVESVDEEENTFLMQTELGTVIVHRGELTTPVYAGMNVTVYFDGVMALSEPGQIAARKIEVPEVQGTVLERTENGLVLRTDDETEYRVILTEETVRGVLLPAAEPADEETAEEKTEEAAEADVPSDEKEDTDAAETEAPSDEEQEVTVDEPAADPAPGDRVTVYFSGEYADEDGRELTALEVLIEKNSQE